MVMFWGSAGILTVATFLLVLFPVFRRSRQRTDEAAYGVHVYRDQLAEIQLDVEQGFLSPDQATIASSEIKRRLLAVADSGVETSPGIRRSLSRTMLVAVALAVPAGILSVYMMLGTPDLPGNPLAGRTDEMKRASQDEHFINAANELLARLKEDLEDVEGWSLLGRTYNALGRTRDSVDAYSRAYALSPNDPAVAAGYGEALVIDQKGYVSAVALKAFDAALKAKPGHIKARYFLGLSKAQTPGKLSDAIGIWTEIVKDSPSDAPWIDGLHNLIARAKESLANIDKKEAER